MNSPSPWPAIYFKVEGISGVFRWHLPFLKWALSHYNFIRLCSFLAAVPEGDMLHVTSQRHCLSRDSAHRSLVGTTNENFFFFGLGNDGVFCFLSKACAHIPLESPRRLAPLSVVCWPGGHSGRETFEKMSGLQETNREVYKGFFSKCFHLELIWECWWRKSSRLSQMVSVESKHTNLLALPSSLCFLLPELTQERVSSFILLPPPECPVCTKCLAPVTSKTSVLTN